MARIHGSAVRQEYAQVLEFILSMLQGYNGKLTTHTGNLFKKFQIVKLGTEVAKLEKLEYVSTDINLKSAVEYLSLAVKFMLGNEEEEGASKKKLARYLAEMSVFAYRNHRQVQNETEVRESTCNEVILAHKLMIIGAYFRGLDPKITNLPKVSLERLGGRRIDDDTQLFLDVTAEEHFHSLNETTVVQAALVVELGKKSSSLLQVFSGRKKAKKPPRRTRKSHPNMQAALKNIGEDMSLAEARLILRGVVAASRILSRHLGEKIDLIYNDKIVSPRDMSSVFENSFVSSKVGKKDSICSFDVNVEKDLAVTGNTSGCIELFSLSRYVPQEKVIEVPSGGCKVLFDHQLLFVGDSTGHIKVYNLDFRQWMQSIKAHETQVKDMLHFSGLLYSCDDKGFIKAWDIFNETDNVFLLKGHSGGVNCLAADSNSLFSGGSDGTIRSWDVFTVYQECKMLIPSKHGEVTALKVNSGEIYSGGVDGCIRIWSEDSGTLLYDIKNAHVETVIALSVDSDFLYSSCQDQILKAWGRNDLKETYEIQLKAETPKLYADDLGNLFASDEALRVWNVDGLLDKGFGEGLIDDVTEQIDHTGEMLQTGESNRSLFDENLDISIMEVLNNNKERRKLMRFLRSRCAQECLLFWNEHEKYKKLSNYISARGLQREAMKIVHQFIEEGSPSEINISYQKRSMLLNLDEKAFNEASFDSVNQDMVKLMDTNFLIEYLSVRDSPEYSDRNDSN